MGDQTTTPAADNDLLMRVVAAIVALMLVTAVIGSVVLFTLVEVKPTNKDIILGLLGSLTLAFGTLMGYLYGRSQASDMHTRADVSRNAITLPVASPPPAPAPTVTLTPTPPAEALTPTQGATP